MRREIHWHGCIVDRHVTEAESWRDRWEVDYHASSDFWGSVRCAALLGAARARSAVLLNVGGPFKAQPEPRMFMFEVPAAVKAALLEVSVAVSEGKATIRVKDPSGKEIFSASCAGTMTIGAQPLKTPEAGNVSPGVGQRKRSGELGGEDYHGGGSSVSGTEFGFGNRDAAGGHLRAFWCGEADRMRGGAGFGVGAAVWMVGVALKFAWADSAESADFESVEGGVVARGVSDCRQHLCWVADRGVRDWNHLGRRR